MQQYWEWATIKFNDIGETCFAWFCLTISNRLQQHTTGYSATLSALQTAYFHFNELYRVGRSLADFSGHSTRSWHPWHGLPATKTGHWLALVVVATVFRKLCWCRNFDCVCCTVVRCCYRCACCHRRPRANAFHCTQAINFRITFNAVVLNFEARRKILQASTCKLWQVVWGSRSCITKCLKNIWKNGAAV